MVNIHIWKEKESLDTRPIIYGGGGLYGRWETDIHLLSVHKC